MTTPARSAWLILLSACCLCSCRSLYPDLGRTRAEALPAAYARLSGPGAAATDAWWTEFGSEEIDTLMARAFADNLTVAQAGARLRQAQAAARKAGAARSPELSATAGAGVSDRSDDGAAEADIGAVETYSLGIAASYELDLWGRVRAGAHSAQLDAEASRLDLEAAAMTVGAQVADRWLQLIEARAVVALLDSQLETSRKLLSLLRARVGKSTTRLLDVYQQEQAVRLLEAARPLAEQRVDMLQNELALLVGAAPGTDLGLTAPSLPALPPQPAAGVPADLLVRRPDVRAELLRLQRAGWDVSAARADRLPALRLTARAGYEADATATLFDNWLANLAASLTAPLLDGGRRRAEARRMEARLDEQLAGYRQTLLTALREVEDALVRERRLQERVSALERHVAGSAQVLAEAQRRYLKGGADYLSVLTALRTTQQAEQDLLGAQRELLSNRVALWRALGGSWAQAAADAAAAAPVLDRTNETKRN